MTDRISGACHAALHRIRLLVPYVVLAVLVPGGSVLTVLLWVDLYRRGRA